MSNAGQKYLFDSSFSSKLRKYYYRFGIKGSLLKALKKISVKLMKPLVQYYEIVLVGRALQVATSADEVMPKIDVTISLFEAKDFEELTRISQSAEKNFIENRINNDENCYVAKHNGQICFYSWISTGERIIHCDCKKIPIGKDEVYIRDCRTVAMFRGKNIAPYFYNYISDVFSKKGFKRAVAYIVDENYASIRSFEKAGFSIYEKARFIRPFFKNKNTCITVKVK